MCGSCGAYLDCMLLAFQVTAGLGFFVHSSHLVHSKDSTPCSNRPQPSLQIPTGIASVRITKDVDKSSDLRLFYILT